MKFTGKLLEILPMESVTSDKGIWKKQDIVVLTKDTYPKKVVLTIWNNQYDVSNLAVDSDYDFCIKIESRLHGENTYTNIILNDNPTTVQNILFSMVSGIKPIKTNAKIMGFLPEKINESWSKKEVLFEPITYGGRFFSVSFMNNKIDLSNFSIGDLVSLELLLESREYSGRWHTDVKAWKIESYH
jgi:hypothetical protein